MPTQIIDITGSGMSQQQENDLNEAKNKSGQNEQNITQLQNDCNNCKNDINKNTQDIAQHTQNISDINALAASAKTKADDAFTLAQSAQGGGGNSSSVEVYDGLDSDDLTKALSAKQGKVLNETKLGKNEKAVDSDKLNGQNASYYGKQSDVQKNTNDISLLQQDKHTHSNKSTLDKLGDSNGDLTYNGNIVGGSGVNVYDVADKAVRDALTGVKDGDVVRYNDAINIVVETRINGEWQRDWVEEKKDIKMYYRVKTSNPPSEDNDIKIQLVDGETDVYDIWTKPGVSLNSTIITSKLDKSKTTEIKVIRHEYNSLRNTFRDFSVMTLFDVENNNVFNNITDMSYAWYNCSSITSFPQIDTNNVTDMNTAWRSCNSLTSFPQIDTSSVTEMEYAWYDCNSLTSFPKIDTSSATNMSYAWSYCRLLTSFPQIDISNATDITSTWSNCYSLTSFPQINTNNVTKMYGAWSGCNSLTSFPQIDTSNVTNMNYAWNHCSSLTSFPQINTSSATNMSATWYSCSNIDHFEELDTRLAASSGGVSNVFDGCNNLQHPTSSEISDLTDSDGAYWTLANGIENVQN